jgi:hypothetical protein
MSVQQQLRQAYDRAAASEPDEAGAYDRFLDRRARHDRAVALRMSLLLVVALALAALVPRAGHQQVTDRPQPGPNSLVTAPDHGFALTVPDGWKVSHNSTQFGVLLQPTRSAATTQATPGGSARITLQTQLLNPRIYPGRPGSPQELTAPALPFGGAALRYSAPEGPFTTGRRADGRQFLRVDHGDSLADPWGQDYWLAWPYQCAPQIRCPAAARYRALLVSAMSPLRERQATQAVLQRVVETVQPIGNAAGRAQPIPARRPCRIPKPNDYPLEVQVHTLAFQPRDAREVALTAQLRTGDLIPCRLRQRVTLELREGGRLAKVQGNPSTVEFDGGLPEGADGSAGFGARWHWRNWCGGRRVRVRYVGLEGQDQSPAGLRPSCLDPTKPSTLELVLARR